jgi:protocatechuate 3,4-dioxygenase beta subunit
MQPPRDDDDRPTGRVVTRREAVALLTSAGVLVAAGCRPQSRTEGTGTVQAAASGPVPGCVVRPEQTEGPYFVDTRLNRSDIRTDPSPGDAVVPGTPLQLTFAVSQLAGGACAPLAGAIVDVWQCDALGVYSGVRDPQFDTAGQQFLRGHQLTDARGMARFTTIYPGWYSGRAVHVHFKIRTAPSAERGQEFTSQLYFPDDLTDSLHADPPYAQKGVRNRRNEQDGIYNGSGGSRLMLNPAREGEGYSATFDVALATD